MTTGADASSPVSSDAGASHPHDTGARDAEARDATTEAGDAGADDAGPRDAGARDAEGHDGESGTPALDATTGDAAVPPPLQPDAAPPGPPDAPSTAPDACVCPLLPTTWMGNQASIAAVDGQGRLLVILRSNATGQDGQDVFTLERRTSATTVDMTFGNEGSVTLAGIPFDMAVGPSGTIVVGARQPDFVETLLAFDATGAPLAGFDATAAITSMDLSAISSGVWPNWAGSQGGFKQRSIAFQPDGKLLVVTSSAAYDKAVVTRLSTDGSADATFASQGYLIVPGSFAWEFALLPSGDFVLVTQSAANFSITATWYSGAGLPLGPTAPIYEDSYEGILARSDGTLLVGTGSGATTTFATYSPLGAPLTGPTIQIYLDDFRFIGPLDAFTYLPGTSAAVTVSAILPSGVVEPNLQATCAVPAGDTLFFLNAIADGTGGVFLLGETCGAIDAGTAPLSCTALVAQLSASGVLTQ